MGNGAIRARSPVSWRELPKKIFVNLNRMQERGGKSVVSKRDRSLFIPAELSTLFIRSPRGTFPSCNVVPTTLVANRQVADFRCLES